MTSVNGNDNIVAFFSTRIAGIPVSSLPQLYDWKRRKGMNGNFPHMRMKQVYTFPVGVLGEVMEKSIGVVILDDEAHIIRLLRALIPWDTYGLNFLGSAQNGIDGRRLVLETKPDIVFTDIKMPGMDGLEMIASLSAILKNTSFIIVSGYAQFDYAKQAITYGVEDYLLKPISQEELGAVVKKLVEKIHARQQMVAAVSAGDASKKDKCIFDGIEHQVRFPISEDEHIYLVALKSDSSEPILPADLSHAVLNHYPEVQGITHVSDLDLFSVELMKEDSVTIERILASITADVQRIREVFPSLEFTLFYRESEGNFHDDYEVITVCLPLRRSYPDQNVIKARPMTSGNPLRLLASWDMECGKAIDSLDSAAFAPSLQAIVGMARGLDPVDAETLLLHAGKRIAVKVEERMGNGLDWYASTFEPGVRLSHDNETLYSRFCGLVIDFIDSLAALRREDVIRPVREAVAYMQEHYMDSDMSLDTVASVVGLSAPYFSGLFKKERGGQGFQDALVQIRIYRAKDLLRSTHSSIANVANAVGYTDVKYFAKLFRKTTGIKPNEFRSLYG